MTVPQRVADMESYLAATGWRRRPETWRGASLWDDPDGHSALVPARDGLDDAGDRSWELLHVLMKVENRPMEEIADDIASPTTDTQTFRTFPGGLPSGYISLTGGLRALNGVRNVVDAAGRAETEGTHAVFTGTHHGSVRDMLNDIRLGPTRAGSYVLTLRVPVEESPQADLLNTAAPLTRRTVVRLFEAVNAARTAFSSVRDGGGYSGFDEAVADGVSANLCRGLSNLAGLERKQPFEIAFRWARDVPFGIAPESINFPAGSGEVIFEAAKQLERLAADGLAQIVGRIESLHDEPAAGDRRRVRVRGELLMDPGDVVPPRPVWVRLGESDYQRAIEAHRDQRAVRARGRLNLVQRRLELVPDPGQFEIVS